MPPQTVIARMGSNTASPTAAAAAATTEQSSTVETSTMSAGDTNALGFLPWVNLLSFAANVAVTYGIGVAGLFDLPSNTVQSEKYQTIVTPVGWAFSIWGIIFLSQGIWALLQVVAFFTGSLPALYVDTIRTVSCNYVLVVISQAAWTLVFASDWILLSTLMMVLILWNLGMIVYSMDRQNRLNQAAEEEDDTPVNNSYNNVGLYVGKYLLLEFPFSIHFGWILAATVVNGNVALVAEGFGASLQYFAAIAGLVLLLGIALAQVYARDFVTIPLVVCWALFGVYSELNEPMESIRVNFSDMQIKGIQGGSLAAMVIILVAVAYTVARRLNAFVSPAPRTGESVYLRADDS
jgi:hypothetical protein